MNEHNKHLESIQANGWITGGGQQGVKTTDGGPGSGNFGHSGRPGEVGGSGGGGTSSKKGSEKKSSSKSKSSPVDTSKAELTKALSDMPNYRIGGAWAGTQGTTSQKYGKSVVDDIERRFNFIKGKMREDGKVFDFGSYEPAGKSLKSWVSNNITNSEMWRDDFSGRTYEPVRKAIMNYVTALADDLDSKKK